MPPTPLLRPARRPVRPHPLHRPYNTRYWSNFYATLGRGYVTPGTFESRKAYLSMSEQGTQQHSTFAPYDQYGAAGADAGSGGDRAGGMQSDDEGAPGGRRHGLRAQRAPAAPPRARRGGDSN